MTYVTPWTSERIELIKDLNAKGWSAGAISNKLDCGLTRCAVLGKLNRMGLATPRAAITVQVDRVKISRPKKSKEPVEHKPVVRVRAMNGNSNMLRFVQSVETNLPTLRVVELETLNIPFADLESHHCRYPFGDDPREMTFCGHPKMEGYSYCFHHKHLAWRKPDPRPVKHFVDTGPGRFAYQRKTVQA